MSWKFDKSNGNSFNNNEFEKSNEVLKNRKKSIYKTFYIKWYSLRFERKNWRSV